MTLAGKEYQFKDFQTIGVRIVGTTYYNLYSAACQKLETALKEEGETLDYEKMQVFMNGIDLAFNMFFSAVVTRKKYYIRFWKNRFVKIDYFECRQEEVAAFAQNFFSGLTNSQTKSTT